MNRLAWLLLSILFISSCCNEVPLEIPKFELTDSKRNVLVEDLTGVRCKNCPDGAQTIKAMQALYPDRVISIAIHAGFLSEPYTESKYDLRCEDGEKIESSWDYASKPAAAIDRVSFEPPDIPIAGYSSWQSYVEEELSKENIVNLEASVDFDTLTRTGSVLIYALPLIDMEGQFKFYAALVENNIIDVQLLSDGTKDEEYEFESVLRDMITSYDGSDISGNLTENEVVNKSYSFSIPESDGTWIPKNMKIVVFMTGTYEHGYETVMNTFEVNLLKE
ncbi:MAG: Omp28-related outer membrane protein [Saprospiraceae bacterium]